MDIYITVFVLIILSLFAYMIYLFFKQRNNYKNSDNYKLSVDFSLSSHFYSQTIKIKQKTKGVLKPFSVDAWNGYVSPSGGYINYARYHVIGINPNTNRKNKRTYEEFNQELAILHAKEEGLVEPFEVSVLPALEPTERQLEYARDLGISIPEGACKFDVSALISRVTDDDEMPASDDLARIANEYSIKLSRYCGRKHIMDAAFNLPAGKYAEFKHTLRTMEIK